MGGKPYDGGSASSPHAAHGYRRPPPPPPRAPPTPRTFFNKDTRKLTDSVMLRVISSLVMDTFATACARHSTFLSANLTCARASSTLSVSESLGPTSAGNLPARFKPGPSRRGICLMSVPLARNASYFLASFLTSFLFLFIFLRSSTDCGWGGGGRRGVGECVAQVVDLRAAAPHPHAARARSHGRSFAAAARTAAPHTHTQPQPRTIASTPMARAPEQCVSLPSTQTASVGRGATGRRNAPVNRLSLLGS